MLRIRLAKPALQTDRSADTKGLEVTNAGNTLSAFSSMGPFAARASSRSIPVGWMSKLGCSIDLSPLGDGRYIDRGRRTGVEQSARRLSV